jgi:hypothetical protein
MLRARGAATAGLSPADFPPDPKQFASLTFSVIHCHVYESSISAMESSLRANGELCY